MKGITISKDNFHQKRYKKNTIRIYFIAFFILIIGFCIFRLWLTRDTVSYLAPIETANSIQILKTRSVVNNFHNNFGLDPFLQALSMDQILMLSKRNFALHLDEFGNLVGITVDQNLSLRIKKSLQELGLYVSEKKNETLISLTENTQTNKKQINIHLWGIIPWYDGFITSSSVSGWVSIHKKGITLGNFGGKADIDTKISTPEQTQIVSQFSSYQSDAAMMDHITNLLPIPEISTLSSIFSSPWKMIFSIDEYGNNYYSLLVENTYTINELAELAKFIQSNQNLSTIALTLNDHSVVYEITGKDSDILISQEQDSFFLHSTEESEELHITQTPSYLLINNFHSSQVLVKNQPSTACKSSAHSFIHLDEFSDSLPNALFISSFSSMAVNNKNLFLCW